MPDIFTPGKRSQIMAKISSKETIPEVKVRSALFNAGFRFRKNVKNLVGKPDIVMLKYKTVIFIHGCFWHGHDCPKGKLPKTNTEFWQQKIEKNQIRDAKNIIELQNGGWKVITVWQCKISSKERLDNTLQEIKSVLLNKL